MMDQTVVRSWQLDLDADRVLRGQGADPQVVRQRRPRVVEMAERALEEGQRLIAPVAAYQTWPVEALRHERLILSGGSQLTGSLLAQHLGSAQQVTVAVCTIGRALEEHVSALMPRDVAYALALDGFGSAATEALSVALCTQLENVAARAGQCTSVPLSPGMIGWPVDVGQPEIFSLLDTDAIDVTLTDSAQMLPRKSASLVLGFAPTPFEAGRPCDFCALRNTCRYQTHPA